MAEKKNKDIDIKPENKDDKLQVIKSAITLIEKNHGKGSIMRLGENASTEIETVPTGSLSLDIATGVGGIPKGRIIEIYGPESGGKTTLALHVVAEVQKRGGIATFIDAEHALDPVYAKKIGVNIDEMYISQPDCGEQALDIAETLIRSGAMDIIVIDSVAALVPRSEIEGEMGDATMGSQARLMGQGLRKLAGIANKSKCIVIFINQIREKLGVMFGSPETTPGGRALRFSATIRIDIRKTDVIKGSGSEIIGNHVRAKIVKNKVGSPHKVAEFDIMFGEGISHVSDVLDLAASIGVVTKGGAWYSYGDTRLGQGRENAKQFLTENPALLLEIENAVRTSFDMSALEATSMSEEEIAAAKSEDAKEEAELKEMGLTFEEESE